MKCMAALKKLNKKKMARIKDIVEAEKQRPDMAAARVNYLPTRSYNFLGLRLAQ